MGCCNNKRKAWLNEVKNPVQNRAAERIPQVGTLAKPDIVFEYTGLQPLTVHGASSGNSYYFRFKGDKVNVHHEDSFALIAEAMLQVVREQPGR